MTTHVSVASSFTYDDAKAHPLWERQVELEQNMRSLGIDRFRTQVQNAVENHRESRTKAVRRLMDAAHQKMVAAIEAFIADSNSGKAGRKHTALKFITKLDVDVVAHLTCRSVLDAVSARQTLQTAAINLGSVLEDEVNFNLFKADMPRAFAKFKQKAMKRGSAKMRRDHVLKPAELLGAPQEEWANKDLLLIGMKLIELFVEATGLCQVNLVKISNRSENSIYVVEATPQTLEWIEEENKRLEWMFPMYLPTVIPPKPWTGVRGGGYWTRTIRSLSLVKTTNRQYLDELSNREMPEVLEAVNALQNTAWAINTRVLEVMDKLWEAKSTIGEIPSADPVDLPVKPVWLTDELTKDAMTDEQKLQFREWKKKASEVHEFNAKLQGRRLHFMRLLWVAKKFAQEEAIYFPHQLDWRGRAYPVPLYLHPQGNDLQRGLLTFANVVPVGNDEGELWLAVHGASCWGVDKVTLEERRQWVLDNEQAILASAADPFENLFWTEAEKPWQALAFCFEWEGYRREGYAFESSLPVQMDGTCNGLQNFSAMLRDEVGGAAVNLVPADKPQDIYAKVAEVVIRKVEHDAVNHEDEFVRYLAQGWLGNITRSVTKRPVMTLAYGARRFGFIKQVEEDTLKPWKEKCVQSYPFSHTMQDGKEVDNTFKAAEYMGDLIWNSVGEVVIAARAAMDWMQASASIAAKEQLPVMWITPDGFLVQQAYRVPQLKKIETAFEGARIRLNITEGGGKIDKARQASGISPNWVHSLDASHLRRTINAAHEAGMRSFCMIHDSYGTHAGNAQALANILREEFVRMYSETNVMEVFRDNLLEQLPLGTELPELPPMGNLDLNLVLESAFFFA